MVTRPERLCTKNSQQTIGDTIFPGDKIPDEERAGYSPEDIRAALGRPENGKGKVDAAVIICITYQSTFEQDYHFTQYLYWLGRPVAQGGYIAAFEPKDTPQGLCLFASTLMGNLAD